MNEIKKEIFRILIEFSEEYSEHRLTQILSNLNINESAENNSIKDNYYDEDKAVLERIKESLTEFKK